MTQLHVIFGAGQVGAALATLLRDRGHRVRVVRRSAAPVAEQVEVFAGDARDVAFARTACEGAAVVYHCMNPSAYTAGAWQAEFPAQGEAVIAGALRAGARLVCLDNLYAYGECEGPRTETTDLAAKGPKGRVRIDWDARLRQAAGEQGLRFVVGRAGDFFGPGAGEHSLFSPSMVRGLAAGKGPWLVGDIRAVHAFSYVPDVASALAALGTAEADVEGRVFLLPVLPVAPADLVAGLAEALGTRVRPRALPGWAIVALSPFVPLMRELRETLYQWDRPFLVDDGPFRARFPEVGASLHQAIVETAAAAA